MKRFLPIPILIAIIALQLFLCSLVPKHHTWTLLHANAANTACSGSGTTCTITVASTTSGNQLVAVAWTPTSTTGKNLSAAGSGGTWVFPANCAAFNNASTGEVSCGYTLSATGGVTSIVLTVAATPSGTWAALIYEYHSSAGGVAVETVPAGTSTGAGTCSTACTAPNVTLAGSADVVIGAIATGNTACSVSSPYGDFTAPQGDGFADNLNTSSGTGANFTQGTACPTAAAARAAAISIAFSESSGAAHPNMPPAIY